MQEFLEIGQIVNTFGIKGMVKVKPFTDDITRFDNLEKELMKDFQMFERDLPGENNAGFSKKVPSWISLVILVSS